MKLRNNIWYHEYSIDDLMDFDNAEIYDDTLKAKAESIS
jgi:hypothetical protein